jgi:hypothetical protein
MERIIPIKNLSPSTATRAHGHKAYLNLAEHLKGGESVILDLRDQELISISFLDEIVLNLKSSGYLEKITFFFNDPVIQQRIARIAAFTEAAIFYRSNESEHRNAMETQPSPELQVKPRKRAAGARVPRPWTFPDRCYYCCLIYLAARRPLPRDYGLLTV